MKALCLALFLALLTPLHSAADTEVVTINYRTANEFLPVIRELLGPEGRVSVYSNNLIIDASSAKIVEIKNLLNTLDRPPRRLLITVENIQGNHSQEQAYGISSSYKPQVNIKNSQTQNRRGGLQTIQASEGYPAFIQTGQSVPSNHTVINGWGQPIQQIGYRDINQGFYVTATLSGDIVHLDISSQFDHASQQQRDVIHSQKASTQISTPLGEWVTVGSNQSSQDTNGQRILSRQYRQMRDDFSIRLKVEALN